MRNEKRNVSDPFGTTFGTLQREYRGPLPVVLILGLLVVLLTACNPTTGYHQAGGMPSVDTTISADGEMIAALDRPGPHGHPRLRIKRLLPQEGAWQDVPISPHISSVRFGLTGKRLLLTEIIDETLRSVLVSWDMDRPETPPALLYEGYRLVFPLEFKPGHYLVRSCNNRPDWKCTDRVHDVQWEWVHDKKQVQLFDRKVQPEPLVYGQPTVVGEEGFFWFVTYKERHFITLSFPGQQLETPNLPYDDKTEAFKCDQAMQRCLRVFRQGLTTERTYIYALSALYAGQLCEVPGLAGYGDAFSLTPDGRAAVTSLAENADRPRRVVVIRFKPGHCAPVSIQHLSFEEKQS